MVKVFRPCDGFAEASKPRISSGRGKSQPIKRKILWLGEYLVSLLLEGAGDEAMVVNTQSQWPRQYGWCCPYYVFEYYAWWRLCFIGKLTLVQKMVCYWSLDYGVQNKRKKTPSDERMINGQTRRSCCTAYPKGGLGLFTPWYRNYPTWALTWDYHCTKLNLKQRN